MNFYQHHIGDFNNATRHLTRIERSIYRDLLELYYDTESPLTSDFDRLARRCIVDDCDRAAMCDVLNEFFILQEDGYHNTRADREIAAFKRMAEGGKRGADKRWGKPTDSHPIATPLPPQAKANANHEPITNNHKPVTKDRESEAKAPRATKKCPTDFLLTNELQTWAIAQNITVDLQAETEKFKDYTYSRSISDWPGAWRNWIRQAQDYAKTKQKINGFTPQNMNKQEALEARNRAVADRFAEKMLAGMTQ